MPKCDFNKVAKQCCKAEQVQSNFIEICKFAAYFQNAFY